MKPKPDPKSNLTVVNNNIDNLLSQKTITAEDVGRLNELERQHFQQIVNNKVEKLKGEEQDDFLNKIALIISPISKSDIWERNHLMVSKAIADHMQRYGIMPTQNTIAQETGLSRQTVAKHIASHSSKPEFIEETERFKFMSHTLLANVFRFASNGDMRAARIYFEMVGAISKQQNDTVNTQNNYIQINNTILNQETLKQLTTEQLNLIEKIVTDKG